MEKMISAIQPTNKLTLGNYLGAIKPFMDNQDKYNSYLFIADLHAITVKQDPKLFKSQVLNILATYIAAGVDKRTTTMFLQSQVSEHAELAWILNCHSSFGELGRMHQFKDKSKKQGQSVSVGLYAYPVLMAADILLYNANVVPVGEDQKQHIELTRDIAERMNSQYGEQLFTVPKGITPASGARVMSLQDPTVKMSKSDENLMATVFLDDSNEDIVKKFKRAVTDSGSEVTDEDSKPGIRNLLEIQAAIRQIPRSEVAAMYVGKQYGTLKVETGELVVSTIAPIRDRTKELLDKPSHLMSNLQAGKAMAQHDASETLERVKKVVGFIL
jgi:tryptophanyl-tRNA synthetase